MMKNADPDFVKLKTGYVIGGVPPIGHTEAPGTLLDIDLQQFDEIWAAGGTPNAVFCLTPDDLVKLTGGSFADISKK